MKVFDEKRRRNERANRRDREVKFFGEAKEDEQKKIASRRPALCFYGENTEKE